MTSTVSE